MTSANRDGHGEHGSAPRDIGGGQDREQLWTLIKDIDVAMLTTEDEGMLRSRPMKGRQSPQDDDIWFFTSREAHKVEEIGHDQQVALTFADPRAGRYVSVSGRASLIDNRDKARELWDDAVGAWFPKGADDPNLLLIRVTPEQAEYWDGPSSMEAVISRVEDARRKGEEPEVGVNVKVQHPRG